jgi:hypothetical protein
VANSEIILRYQDDLGVIRRVIYGLAVIHSPGAPGLESETWEDWISRSANRWVNSYKGETVRVHVDPRDPARSVLRNLVLFS